MSNNIWSKQRAHICWLMLIRHSRFSYPDSLYVGKDFHINGKKQEIKCWAFFFFQFREWKDELSKHSHIHTKKKFFYLNLGFIMISARMCDARRFYGSVERDITKITVNDAEKILWMEDCCFFFFFWIVPLLYSQVAQRMKAQNWWNIKI